VVRTLDENHGQGVHSVAYSPDGQMLASGGDDCAIKLWDANTWKLAASWSATDPLSCLAFAPNGRVLATCGNPFGALTGPNEIMLWQLPNGEPLRDMRGHTSQVHKLAWSNDSRTLSGCSHDGSAKLWDVATGANRFTFTGFNGVAYSIAFSPDGSAMAAGDGYGTVRIWRATVEE
jgi:WD40 repeat protein